MVVLLLPVGMLIINHTRTVSTQFVPGTFTIAGDMTKLVIISTPTSNAAGGTLMAFPTCWQPWKGSLHELFPTVPSEVSLMYKCAVCN